MDGATARGEHNRPEMAAPPGLRSPRHPAAGRHLEAETRAQDGGLKAALIHTFSGHEDESTKRLGMFPVMLATSNGRRRDSARLTGGGADADADDSQGTAI